ncbi:MBL fold metallo-hydrolase [Anaerocolumna aminovalerica]|uniref:Glyoxylase, beta-lactamase superfamily II n=1 Tax=Anaerocolumna aminovalerica TaxID=1527 RepID=A0A1I5C585_9FIRM|nr:MBL fold metallo-hydrolase [Anaerocolumna aminovalerica]SFN82006.1 Glyoxylase, beta-lactamase superfamily II [Anaerocolumna aminovalerica]
MKIETYVLGPVMTNCYFAINEDTKETIIIDPADKAEVLIQKINKETLKPVAVLLTHGHFDHILAASEIAVNFHIPIYASKEEKELLETPSLNLSVSLGKNISLTPTMLLNDKDIIKLAGTEVNVIHTPGHTSGGICYLFKESKILFSGDTLFEGTVGRADLPTGNLNTLLDSVNHKLMTLPDDTTVFPGHGESTTVGHERNTNPYVS